MGSPRHELQTTSNTANAPCAAGRINSAIAAASMVRSPVVNVLARARNHDIRTAITGARRTAGALQRATAGRPAHDEHGAVRPLAPIPVAEVDSAVKNLRITDSAVLLLNFREVRRFHFCSVRVAV